jgi:Cu/Ag efflux pump CusA
VLLRWLKFADERVVRFALRRPWLVLGGAALGVLLSLGALSRMGGEFLPPFAEGTLTVNLLAEPGTTLAESNRLGKLAETQLLEIPEVAHTARRTGRAELDEHAEGVNASEIEVSLRPSGRHRVEVMAEVRDRLAHMAGVAVMVGQPISHRLDHIMSGVRAQVAVKLFSNDLTELRELAARTADAMSEVPGVVDLRVEPQVEVPELLVRIRRDEAARLGLTVAHVAEVVEAAVGGHVAGQALDRYNTFDMVVWLAPEARGDPAAIRAVPISLSDGRWVPLGRVAEVTNATGPNTINREGVQRRIAVSCNVQGRDLVGTVEEIRRRVDAAVGGRLPDDGFVQYGGQFEAQQQGRDRLLWLALAGMAGIFLLLLRALGSWRAALQCLANIPLAALGGILGLIVTATPAPEALAAASWWQWPAVYVDGASVSLATWIGFITVTGIVSRNGIMMISHYIHLMRHEGESFSEAMVVRGTLERLAPVLMTTLTTCIALIPLALGAGETGKELLHPLAIVVIGGLAVSALLDQLVTPALFFHFGRKVYAEVEAASTEDLPNP